MTKQPPYVSTLRLSRACRLILTLGILKLILLFSMFIFPEVRLSDIAVAAPDSVGTSGQKEGVEASKATGNKNDNQISRSSDKPLSNIEPLPLGNASPPAPNVKASGAPFFQDVSEQPDVPVRPDEAVSEVAPAPKLSPFVPRDSVQRKQEELNRREEELLALQTQMQSRLDELKQLEDKIQKMLEQANEVQDKKLMHLIDVYSNMKAKQAADVLATLDPRIAVKILSGMRGRQAGEILTYMASEPAAKLSELLSRTNLP